MGRSIFLLSFTAALAMGQTASWSVNCGLWRTDAGFKSTIELKNRLVSRAISVTPALFMADGTEYDLPAIGIPASGLRTINVIDALAAAPASIASHISTFGSATVRYTGLQ